MDRIKALDMWEASGYGGPDLEGSEDAVRFAMAAYEDVKACNSLILQRTNLESLYKDLYDVNNKHILKRAEIAFKLQFTHDAIREVVRISSQIINVKNPEDLIRTECPFCRKTLQDHKDNGDCPE